jgi:hypothetical protein
MYLSDDITWEQFEQRFREAFRREMTPDEHRWFQALWTIANRTRHEKAEGAAA